jgi:hypothetical protein
MNLLVPTLRVGMPPRRSASCVAIRIRVEAVAGEEHAGLEALAGEGWHFTS